MDVSQYLEIFIDESAEHLQNIERLYYDIGKGTG